MQTDDVDVLDTSFLIREVRTLNPRPPVSLRMEDSLDAALSILKQNNIGCVVITDADGKLRGIFTERDVMLKVIHNEVNMRQSIAGLMTADPECVKVDAQIVEVLQMMSAGGYRHMPIIDANGIASGIVSVKDIVDYITKVLTPG